MCEHRPDRKVHAFQHTLRLAKAVCADDRAHAAFGIAAPPLVDLREHIGGIGPAVDRQAEGAFGDEGVATDAFVWRADTVDLPFVIAGGDPYFTLVLHAHLHATGNMSRGMKAEFHAVDRNAFAVIEGADAEIPAKACPHDGRRYRMAQVFLMSCTGVIAVAVGDQRFVHPAPRIDVHAGLCAENATLVE